MKVLFAALSFILGLSISPISAYEECDDGSYTWSCDYTCCYDYSFCCNTYDFAAVYWYIWVIIVIFIVLCVCACVGGGYGYRRHYVRRVYYQVPPTTTVVTTAGNQGYGYQTTPPAYNPNMGGYQQGPPKY